jgi:hypothetical protein
VFYGAMLALLFLYRFGVLLVRRPGRWDDPRRRRSPPVPMKVSPVTSEFVETEPNKVTFVVAGTRFIGEIKSPAISRLMPVILASTMK